MERWHKQILFILSTSIRMTEPAPKFRDGQKI